MDSLRHVLCSRRSKRGAEEQLVRNLAMLGQEPRAPTYKNALLDTEVENFLFDFENATMGCVGVQSVINL